MQTGPQLEDLAPTPVSLRRVAALFRPYRVRLGGLLTLIFVAAGLGVISPFLLRQIIDSAYPHKDTHELILLVAGMIVLSILTGALGVAQTWISTSSASR